MRTHLIILVLILPSVLMQGQTFDTYKGDTINYTDRHGLKQGLWIRFNNDQTKIIEQGLYSNNKKDGIWVRYYDNKQKKHEINYQNGKAIGHACFYYENGLISEEGNWHIDHWQGNYKFYNKNGSLAYDWNYDEAGNRTGEQKYYHTNGTLKYSGTWIKGEATGTLKIYNDAGKLITERVYNNGEFVNNVAVTRNEHTNEQAPTQNIAVSNSTFNGTGMHTIYNLVGKVEQKGFFVKGKLFNGKQYIYDDENDICKIVHYKNGKINETQEM